MEEAASYFAKQPQSIHCHGVFHVSGDGYLSPLSLILQGDCLILANFEKMNDNTSVLSKLKSTTMQTKQIVFKDITLKNAKLLFTSWGKKKALSVSNYVGSFLDGRHFI